MTTVLASLTSGATTAQDASFGERWLLSPGFGGAAALLAAVIAYLAARGGVKNQRDSDRRSQWWQRAQWALDLTFSDDTEARTVGFKVLDALAESEWAAEHEIDVIAAATDRALFDDGIAPDDQDSTLLPWYRRMGTRRRSNHG